MGVLVNPGIKRLFVPPQDWGVQPGTDFMLLPEGEILTANGYLLSDYGWTTTSLSLVTGAGADFIASADVGVPGHILTNASGDLLQSPVVFGDYYHAWLASKILGYVPSTLVVEVIAAFSVATANETTSGFGLIEDGGGPATANDALAYIFSDSANFGLRSGAASDAGAAVDNAWHVWRIEVDSTNVEWFIDDTSQGTIALEADEWPVSFGMHTLTTNRVLLGPVHIYYY